MTPVAIEFLTPHQQTSDAAPQPTAEQRRVAQQFEAIFMRHLMRGMEKSSGLSGSSGQSGQVYRSMMVGAIADSASEAGGIGLSELILKAMMPPSAPGGPAPGPLLIGERRSELTGRSQATPATPSRGAVR